MSTSAPLLEASNALAAGEPVRALPLLLAAWRAHRSDRLAALVERVSDLAEAAQPKVPGATTKARLAAGLALLKAGDPVDVPRVFRLLADVKIAEAAALVPALAKLAPDPRFLRQLVALLVAPPWGSSTGRKLWRALFDALVAQGDPRSTAQLTAIDFRPIIGNDWGTVEMTKLVKRTVARITATPAVDDAATAAACAAIEQALAHDTGDGDALLARIYAAPNDLGPRTIYADWLQERGDPRGELIALQLAHAGTAPSDAQRRREAQLLENHGAEWLGALAPACVGEPRFAGGFAVELRVDVGRALGTIGAPAWSTVTGLWLGPHDAWPRALVRHPVMRELRFVDNVTLADVRAIVADREPWAIAGLGIDLHDGVDKRDLAALATLAKLPALRELGLDLPWNAKPAVFRALWSTPLGKRLVRLRVCAPLATIPAWLAEQPQLPPGLTALEVVSADGWTGWTCVLTRGKDGRLSQLDVVLGPNRDRGEPDKASDLVEGVLDELAADALEAFSFRIDRTRASKAELFQLAAAAARQTRLTTLAIAGKPATVPRVPVAKVKDVRAAKQASAAATARGALVRAAAALPSAKVVAALDLAKPATVAALRKALKAVRSPVPKAWIEVAYALLALPDVAGAGDAQREVR
ncbi:MAG TPA: TIGR02996 domain-containing protein, partial [Kofleriaceae bacterium]|nr:TIGR02996 domain-containing protein [Kofleriaceae bacterium]